MNRFSISVRCATATAAALLTLLVIPTFYEILDEWREWLMSRFRSSKPADSHPDPETQPAIALKTESYG